MEGSSHTMTNEPLPGDSTIQGEIEHLNEGNSQPNNNEPTPVHNSMITEESINRLRGLKDELFHIETDTTNEKMECSIGIPRVPLWLRENKAYSECFDPAVVSIGPYHHGKPKLARIEKLKIISARRFVTDCNSSIRDIYSKLEPLTSQAKMYYDDSIMANFDNEAFTVMMLLDGCFILDFIQQVEFGEGWMLMRLGNDIPLISRDLLLLENQLPYLILKVLILDYHGDVEILVDGYINSEISKTYGMHEFLNSFFSSEVGRLRMHSSPSTGQNRDQKMHSLPGILDLFRAKLVWEAPFFLSRSGQERREQSKRLKRSYPPVKELVAMGIIFKRKNSICFCDVEFRTHLLSGELLLPQIEINHYTKDRFLNLIAYELSYDIPESSDASPILLIPRRAFIAFICFLDTLIDYADDVKVLRSEGIICNYLGSDEEVANLINQLATGLPRAPAYSEVIDEIQSHLQKKWKVYIGEFMHTYFHSPWTTIALIAAGYVILLTSIQTFFTVFPR